MQTQLKQSDTGTEATAPKLRNYVDGAWVTPQTETHLDVTNPATGETIAQVPISTKEDTDAAVARRTRAFPRLARHAAPGARPPALCGQSAHGRAFRGPCPSGHARTRQDPGGRPRLRAPRHRKRRSGVRHSRRWLMGYGLEDGAAKGIDKTWCASRWESSRRCVFQLSPDGAVLVRLMRWPGGNTYIIKPSEQVPTSMQLIFEELDACGFPPGVINVVNGSKEAVDALLDSPQVRGISFVGSTPTARYLYARAGEQGSACRPRAARKTCLWSCPTPR